MEHVDVEAIRAARFKVVLDYAYGAASFVMPNVLAKLGAEVLAVNPYAYTRQALTFDRWQHAGEVAELVRAAGAHLGAVIDSDGEHLTLVDDSGHVLTDDEGAAGPAAAGARRPTDEADRRPAGVVPAGSSRPCAEAAGATLIWTKLSTPHLMEVASLPGVDFAASQEGGYIFPAFLPAYDARGHLRQDPRAAGRQRPPAVAGGRRPAPGPHRPRERGDPLGEEGLGHAHWSWSRPRTASTMLVDGVKVLHDDGWALVLPDPEEPLTHVWAEAATDADARARAQEYARRIRQMIR